MSLRARVKQGRLVLDEPTELPEGTEVELTAAEVPAVGAAGLIGMMADEPELMDEVSAHAQALRKQLRLRTHDEP